MSSEVTNDSFSRRGFVKTAGAAAAVGSVAAPNILSGYQKGGKKDTIKVGLIGCGGRGTGAVVNILKVDQDVQLVAMADAFGDRLDSSLKRLSGMGALAKRINVPKENQFVGIDAYKKLMKTDVDVVLMATPPHFRPMHIEAAVAAGKHIFAEKPLGVDAVGIRKVMKAVKECEKKGLSFLSGFCYRHHTPMVETVKRIQKGDIGEIMNVQCSYNTGALWNKSRQNGWSDLEYTMRNWLYYTWLSGDHICEQGIHNVDKLLWVMGDKAPKSAYAMGGRQVRTESPKYGHVWDHFSVVYEWDNNIFGNFTCRQQRGTDGQVSDIIRGTKGTANLMRSFVLGENRWKFRGKARSMYENEHMALVGGIRSGKIYNNGMASAISSMMGVMGRQSAYTGKRISWDQIMKSNEDLTPDSYDFKAKWPMPGNAMPGVPVDIKPKIKS